MSGEVPTRKRKDRKKRKANLEQLQKEEYLDERTRINLSLDDDDDIVFRPSRANQDETLLLNTREENRGSGWCSKLVFLILLGSIGLAIGVVFLEIDANQQLSSIVADSAAKVSSLLQDTSETVTSLWSEHGESASEIYETVKKTIGLDGEPQEDKVPLEDLEEPKPSEESKEAVGEDEEFFDEGGEMFEEEEERGLPIETPEGNVIPEPVQPGDVYEEIQTNQESREEPIPEVEGDAPDGVVSTPVESPDEAQSIPQEASNLENFAEEKEEVVPEIIKNAPQDFVLSSVDVPDEAQSVPQEEGDVSEVPTGMHEDAVSTHTNKEQDQRFEEQTLNAADGIVEGVVSTPVDSPLEAQSIPEKVLEQHNSSEEFVEMAESSESSEAPIDNKEAEQDEQEILEDFVSTAAKSSDEAQSIPEEVVQTHNVQQELVEAFSQPGQKEAEEEQAPDNVVSTAADSPQEAQSVPEEVLLQDTHSVVDEIVEAAAGDNLYDEKFEAPEVKYNAPDDMVSAPANPDPELVQSVPKPEAKHTDELYPDSYGQRKEIPAPSETPDEEEEDEDEDISAERASYSKSSITSNLDWEIRDELDDAEDTISKSALEALTKFEEIIRAHPNSPRALYGRALALEKLSDKERSNSRLEQAIFAYRNVIDLEREVPDELYRLAGTRCVDRMKFRGFQGKAIRTQQRLILRFPEDLSLRNELAVIYMTVGQNDAAKELLEDTLKTWPDSGFAKAHYGFILKNIHHDIKEGARYMREGIDSGEEGIDGRFYYHLGDAYERLGRRSDAEKIYEEGARRGYFRSKDQRSLYNVDRLESKPFWTKEETTYETFLNKLEANWEIIRDEGLSLMNLTPPEGFKDESESLRDTGDWKQFELYARGRKLPGCSKAPKTCALIGSFEPASSCKRGQAKFSVMHPGTHVWAHTGPTNCRLRSHLGLKVSEGMVIRVVNETRTWEEGKIFVFDDSFDHEVWHNGTEFRLVLIVDLWHPDLTENERQTLPAI